MSGDRIGEPGWILHGGHGGNQVLADFFIQIGVFLKAFNDRTHEGLGLNGRLVFG